jgi:hypothetical protein
MATAGDLITDAFVESGVYAPGETPTAQDQALGFTRLTKMLNGWKGVRLSTFGQLRTTFTLPSGTTTVTVGPGLTVNITTPAYLNAVSYLVPGTNPAVEVPIGQLDEDAYSGLTIKDLSSTLPMQSFYQNNPNDGNATLTFWPKVSQNVTIAIYSTQMIGEPTALSATLEGPVGVAEAAMYQLALRLCGAYQKPVSPDLRLAASNAMKAMEHRNVSPGVLGTDTALIPSIGAGYNVISDGYSSSR